MNILLFGKNGQLGWELQRSLAPIGELTALDRNSTSFCGDLSNLTGLAKAVATLKPDVIVNAAAYTAVDKAEKEAEQSYLINTQAPALLADEARKIGALLVHYSTDYVFDGRGDLPWKEEDTTAPLNVYGQTKEKGEKAIMVSGCSHLIFRTSWVYGSHGSNFLKTILRLAKERPTLSIINDQIGAPTGADLIADISAHAILTCRSHLEKTGLYHLTASGACSWYDYARYIVTLAHQAKVDLKVTSEAIAPIRTSDFPTTAQRPHNSRLDTSKLFTTMGLYSPPWQDGVAHTLQQILGH